MTPGDSGLAALQDLFERLLDGWRGQGHGVGMDTYVAVQDLLAELHRRGALPQDP